MKHTLEYRCNKFKGFNKDLSQWCIAVMSFHVNANRAQLKPLHLAPF